MWILWKKIIYFFTFQKVKLSYILESLESKVFFFFFFFDDKSLQLMQVFPKINQKKDLQNRKVQVF